MQLDALVIETIPPELPVVIFRVPNHIGLTAVRTFFHVQLLVKTALNLEAAHRCSCQDSITYTQEVSDDDYQENFDTVLLQSGEDTACSDRSLDGVNRGW